MSSKSFESHQSTAIERQDVARVALENVFNVDYFASYEEDDTVNKDLDTQGIDAEISTDEGTKFIAIKTRSTGKEYKDTDFNLDIGDIDIALRVAGRNRHKSMEWERFISDSKPVPHILVFISYEQKYSGKEVAEILVIDFKKLKEMYKLGIEKRRLMHEFGEVKYYDSVIDTDVKNAMYNGDDGIFAFLNLEDIRNTSCVLYHNKQF